MLIILWRLYTKITPRIKFNLSQNQKSFPIEKEPLKKNLTTEANRYSRCISALQYIFHAPSTKPPTYIHKERSTKTRIFIYKPIFQPITLINHPKTAQPRTKRPRKKLKKKSTLKLLKMFENKMRILVLWIGKSAETSLTCSTTLQNPSRVEIRARRRLFRGNFQSKKKDDNRRL